MFIDKINYPIYLAEIKKQGISTVANLYGITLYNCNPTLCRLKRKKKCPFLHGNETNDFKNKLLLNACKEVICYRNFMGKSCKDTTNHICCFYHKDDSFEKRKEKDKLREILRSICEERRIRALRRGTKTPF
jgi:hypothetical protein